MHKIIKLSQESEFKKLFFMIQDYEKEFSVITKKTPNKEGNYSLDFKINEVDCFFLLEAAEPIAFCVKGLESGIHDIAEFFVVPAKRSNGLGAWFAQEIFKKYSGSWQVRQIEGADLARNFWRKTIKAFTQGNFKEEQSIDPYWGKVTKQSFKSVDYHS